MTQQRDPKMMAKAERDTKPAYGTRKIASVGKRGAGIAVHRDEPFDPNRFQDFEVTPAFRERILKAPLPLLELRDIVADQAPLSQQPRRAGADDTTTPDIRNPDLGAAGGEALPTAAIPVNRSPSAARKFIIVGALAVAFLGLAFAHLNKPSPAPAALTPNLPKTTVENATIAEWARLSTGARRGNPRSIAGAECRGQCCHRPIESPGAQLDEDPKAASAAGSRKKDALVAGRMKRCVIFC